jgi:hypothetical protein
MLPSKRGTVVTDGNGEKVVLDIRIPDAGAAADEPTGLEVIGGTQAVVSQQPARADERLAERIHVLVQSDGLQTGDLEIKLHVVLEVLSHPGQIMHNGNSQGGQLRLWSHARQLQ